MLMGDVNADTCAIPTLKSMIEELGWTDVGGIHHLCEQMPNMPTCKVSAASRATRRDYVIVNEHLLPAVIGCKVAYDDVISDSQPGAGKDPSSKGRHGDS